MILKHTNFAYRTDEPLLPFIIGDRRYGQDIVRDFYSTLSHIGSSFHGLTGASSYLLSGGAVTANVPSNAVDVAELWAIINSQVEVNQDFSTTPPPKQTVSLSVPVYSAAQTAISISGATLDGSTVNYVKASYSTSTVNTRDRVKRTGTYAFEVQPGITITVDSTAPTSFELSLATFVGTTVSDIVITQTEYRMTPTLRLTALDATSVTANTGSVSGVSFSAILATIVWSERQVLDGVVLALAFGNNTFVAGTGANSMWSSSDAVTWTEHQDLDGLVVALAFGNNTFVAGTGNPGNSIWSSDNGSSWTEQQTLDGAVLALAFGSSKFVAGTGANSVWTSSNGETWTEHQDLDGSVASLLFANAIFVAGTGDTGDSVWTSSNGETWTERQTLDGDVVALAFGNGTFVAGTSANSVWTSSDGETWTNRQTLDGDVSAILFGSGLFVAGTSADSVWTSADGIIWNERQNLDGDIRSIIFGAELFVAGTNSFSIWTPGL